MAGTLSSKKFIDANGHTDTSVGAITDILIICQNMKWTEARIKWLTTLQNMS